MTGEEYIKRLLSYDDEKQGDIEECCHRFHAVVSYKQMELEKKLEAMIPKPPEWYSGCCDYMSSYEIQFIKYVECLLKDKRGIKILFPAINNHVEDN